MDEEGLTQRERRRQEHLKKRTPVMTGEQVRKALPWVLLLVIGGAVAGGMIYTAKQAEGCPGHWHSTFQVYVPSADDPSTPVAVNFHDSYFAMGADPYMSEAVHMHQADNKNQLHFEQNGICTGVADAFHTVNVQLTKDSLTLDGRHEALGQAGSWKTNGTAGLQIYVRDVEGAWTHPAIKSVLDYQLKDGEGILIFFGDYTAEQVQAMQDSVETAGE